MATHPKGPVAHRYCVVQVRMYGDEKFKRLSRPQPNAQSLWCYLLHGPRTTRIPGVIIGGRGAMACDDLKWPLEDFARCFDELLAEKMVAADWDAGLVYLVNAFRQIENLPASPNTAVTWKRELANAPECPLLRRILSDLREALKGMHPSFLRSFDLGRSSDLTRKEATSKARKFPRGNQEHKQEQEHEHEPYTHTARAAETPPPPSPPGVCVSDPGPDDQPAGVDPAELQRCRLIAEGLITPEAVLDMAKQCGCPPSSLPEHLEAAARYIDGEQKRGRSATVGAVVSRAIRKRWTRAATVEGRQRQKGTRNRPSWSGDAGDTAAIVAAIESRSHADAPPSAPCSSGKWSDDEDIDF